MNLLARWEGVDIDVTGIRREEELSIVRKGRFIGLEAVVNQLVTIGRDD